MCGSFLTCSGHTQKSLTATRRSAAPRAAMISVELGEMEIMRRGISGADDGVVDSAGRQVARAPNVTTPISFVE